MSALRRLAAMFGIGRYRDKPTVDYSVETDLAAKAAQEAYDIPEAAEARREVEVTDRIIEHRIGLASDKQAAIDRDAVDTARTMRRAAVQMQMLVDPQRMGRMYR